MRDLSKVPSDFSHHVILYAKNWYGRTHRPLKDLRQLLSLYSGTEYDSISDNDIYERVVCAFSEYVRNPRCIYEAILDMLGKKWTMAAQYNDREIEIMLGKLEIIDGCYCDPAKKLDIKFEEVA